MLASLFTTVDGGGLTVIKPVGGGAPWEQQNISWYRDLQP